MSENRVLRRIFGPKWDEVVGSWRNLHNGELRHLYSSRYAIMTIKSGRSKECSTDRGDEKWCFMFGIPGGKKDLVVDGWMSLKWIFG
jgi:hypothetical protein